MRAIKKHIYKLLVITYKCVNSLEYSIYIEFDHLKDTIFESYSSNDGGVLCTKQSILIVRKEALERLRYG